MPENWLQLARDARKAANRLVDANFDDWLYIEVIPARAGVRASDHASLMTKIERELRAQGNDQVLLVPVLQD